MANNFTTNPGVGGADFASDDIGGVHYPIMKIGHGADGTADDVTAANPLPVESVSTEATKPHTQYLTAAGDGTGAIDFKGDYSGAEGQFYVQPAAGEIFIVHRVIFFVQDDPNWQAEEYANTGGVLSPGISLQWRVDDFSAPAYVDFTAGNPITTNGEWQALCHDWSRAAYGTGDDAASARFSFDKFGPPLRLVGDNNDRLTLVLNDDLSGITKHRMLAEGCKVV